MILISVATYRRPELLKQLLRSLEDTELSEGVRLCVVDNDPTGSAESTAMATSLPVTYVREPTPGIAAARNRGLAEVRDDDDFIVFVDDDERVGPDWMTELLEAQLRYDADVVSGPVVSVFPPGTPRWVAAGGFIQRARFATGSPSSSPATNNALLRADFWRSAGRPTFDESFSLTGGSDTAFFRGLRDAGASMVWTDDAVVYEDVPISRTSFRWIWRRGVREGNVSGRLHLRVKPRARLVLDGAARIAYGAARQAVCLVAGRGLDAKSVAYVTRGVGWVGASANRLVVEYARTAEMPGGVRTETPTTSVFILCSGQEDNIGDVVLRRRLLSELRPLGQLHVFLGQASPQFREGLALDDDDVVYADKAHWRRALWRAIRRGDAWLVDKPGELLLDRRHLAAHARLAVVAVATRIRGGTVLRLGLGQRTPHPGFTRLYRPLLATANIVAWRDPRSQESFRLGEVMPDWGFGEVGLATPGERRRLALSCRSDRPELSDEAVAGILAAADSLGLNPVVVTQVGRDDDRSRSLADRLGCELIDWRAGRSHTEQEQILRRAYAQSAIVVSDRLHVLIVAMTEGAVPLSLTEHHEEKIARHFDAVGLQDVSVQVRRGDARAAQTAVEGAAGRAAECREALSSANARIAHVGGRITARPHVPTRTAGHA